MKRPSNITPMIIRAITWMIYRSLCIALILFVSCRQYRPLSQIIPDLKLQLSRSPDVKKAKEKLPALERLLDEMMEVPISQREIPILCKAVSRYRLYFFVIPDKNRLNKLKKYQKRRKSFADYCPSNHLTRVLACAEKRNIQAEKALALLIDSWQKHPEKWKDFFKKLQVKYEVGGIFFYPSHKEIQYRFLEDKRREYYTQLIEEFHQNDFGKLDQLEQCFRERFSLQKAGKKQSSVVFVEGMLAKSKRHFAKLRKANKEDHKTIDLSKQVLLNLGLEKMLLQYTYTIDKTPYLCQENLAFFFHTHPDDGKSHNKSPSGHDKTMSFRSGPSLVFDIQKRFAKVYLVRWGVSSYIESFSF